MQQFFPPWNTVIQSIIVPMRPQLLYASLFLVFGSASAAGQKPPDLLIPGVETQWTLRPGAGHPSPPMSFDLDAQGRLWLAYPPKTLRDASEDSSFTVDKSFRDFIWLDNQQSVLCADSQLGFVSPAIGGQGQESALKFQPALTLKYPEIRLYPGLGSGLFVVGKTPEPRADILWLEIPAARSQARITRLRGFSEDVGSVAGSEQEVYAVLGRKLVRVNGESMETVFTEPKTAISALAYSPETGLFFATDSYVGVFARGKAFRILAAANASLRVHGDALYVLLAQTGGVLKIPQASRISEVDPAVLEAKGLVIATAEPAPAPASVNFQQAAPLKPEPAAPEPASQPELVAAKTTESSRRLIAGTLILAGLLILTLSLRGRSSRRRAVGASATSTLPDSAPSITVLAGKYELGRQIGAGGMGLVFLARDRVLSRPVAIKRMRSELRDSPAEWERFIQEARTISQLSHPYIVGVHEIVEQAGELYLVFEYVDGDTLAQLIMDRGQLKLKECQTVFQHICEAVDFAHRRRILHRDIKPANIMVDQNGYAKVMDFGLAREAKDSLSRLTSTSAAGTLAYMAPEQHRGKPELRSDIYSLGVCLYEALTGDLPFPGPDLLAQKESGEFVPASTLVASFPRSGDDLLRAALAPRPQERISSALELLELLKNCA